MKASPVGADLGYSLADEGWAAVRRGEALLPLAVSLFSPHSRDPLRVRGGVLARVPCQFRQAVGWGVREKGGATPLGAGEKLSFLPSARTHAGAMEAQRESPRRVPETPPPSPGPPPPPPLPPPPPSNLALPGKQQREEKRAALSKVRSRRRMMGLGRGGEGLSSSTRDSARGRQRPRGRRERRGGSARGLAPEGEIAEGQPKKAVAANKQTKIEQEPCGALKTRFYSRTRFHGLDPTHAMYCLHFM